MPCWGPGHETLYLLYFISLLCSSLAGARAQPRARIPLSSFILYFSFVCVPVRGPGPWRESPHLSLLYVSSSPCQRAGPVPAANLSMSRIGQTLVSRRDQAPAGFGPGPPNSRNLFPDQANFGVSPRPSFRGLLPGSPRLPEPGPGSGKLWCLAATKLPRASIRVWPHQSWADPRPVPRRLGDPDQSPRKFVTAKHQSLAEPEPESPEVGGARTKVHRCLAASGPKFGRPRTRAPRSPLGQAEPLRCGAVRVGGRWRTSLAPGPSFVPDARRAKAVCEPHSLVRGDGN
jgi:hypothetical protein